MHDSSDSSGSILFDFADQLMSDLEAGRALPLAHYLARFPGHEEHVAREFLSLTGKTPAQASTVEGTAARIETRSLDRIGPYRLIDVLGRGGQGIVYRAEDVRLDRTVALKVLTLSVDSVSLGRRNRFRREAEVVSRLDHPGICTVLDADLEGEVPYIAMRFIEGETLAAALTRARAKHDLAGARATAARDATPNKDTSTSASRLLAPRRALELAETLSFFERAARALHAAHEAGVVHRDVKPGNIMVSSDGAPVVLDFGLARVDEEGGELLTRCDEVFGTPAYVSPEQLHGGRNLDRRTDVYSLGVVLYECLTLTRPFQGDSDTALAQAIANAPVPPVRRLNPTLPADLAVVLQTALERDVARRYPTALELAEELRRVREYEPIHARPAGPGLRLMRWTQRNPVVATATIGSIAALAIALVVALVLLDRVGQEKSQKEAALHLYEGGWYRDLASTSLSVSPPRALHLAIAAAEIDPGLASNRVLLGALEALHTQQVLIGHEKMVMQIDIDRSSTFVLTSSLDGTARVWNARTGLELGLRTTSDAPILCARFSPDGERFVISGSRGVCTIHRTSAPETVSVSLTGHTSDVCWAEFSPDGSRVVTASRDHTARVFDANSGHELVRLAGHTGCVAEARFLGDGRFVLTRSDESTIGSATAESDFTARLFDVESGSQLHVFRGHTATIGSFVVSPDQRRLVTTSDDRTARVWRLDDPALEPLPERVFTAPNKFHSAAFSPDGRDLALAWDAGGKVVDVETGVLRYELPDHEHRAIVGVAFSPDGRDLATISYDDALRLFRASDGALLCLCRCDSRQLCGLRWSPDGSFIVTRHRQAMVNVWYGAERPFLQVLRGHTGPVRSSRFDSTGEHVVTASADGTARTWKARSGELERVFAPRHDGPERTPLVGALFDTSGERIATTDEQGRVTLWSARDAASIARYEGRSATNFESIFSPDGTRLALSEQTGCVLLVEIASGRTRRLRAHAEKLSCMRFSADGTCIATGGDDRCVCLWDATFAADAPCESEVSVPKWRGVPFESYLYRLKSVFDVALSPDGRWLVAACESVCLQLFDLRDGRLCDEVRIATPGQVMFDADGRTLVCSSKYVNFTTIWRIEEEDGGGSLTRLRMQDEAGFHHANSMTSLALATRARHAVTGSLDRTARLWDLDRRECVASYAGHTDSVLDADITGDGERIVTACADGTARLWPGRLLALAKLLEPRSFAQHFGPLPTPDPQR